MGDQAKLYFLDPVQVHMATAIEDQDTHEIAHLIETGAVKAGDFANPLPSENAPQYNYLTFAVEFKRKASMKVLLEHGADPNAKSERDGDSAIGIAAASDDVSLLPMLVASGGNVNMHGRTQEPLTFDAYGSGRFENLQFLLDHGINLNAQDEGGETFLEYLAGLRGYDWMLKVLERGADPKIGKRGNTYMTAWTVQASAGRITPVFEAKRQEVIRVLEARGITFPVPPPPRWDSKLHKYVDKGS